MQAVAVAKEIAPYVHPKLKAIQVSGPNGDPLPAAQNPVIVIYDNGRGSD